MLKVLELRDRYNLPKEFIDVLPVKCVVCGADTEIVEPIIEEDGSIGGGLTQLRCSNPNCKEKGVQRLVSLLEDIGVDELGEAKCRKFLEKFNTTNPYSIFAYEPDIDGELYEGCNIDFAYRKYEEIRSKVKMQLWEYIKIGNLVGIRDIAKKLVDTYKDLDTFYEDMYEGGIEFIRNQLGIKSVESIRATQVYETLEIYENELKEHIEFVDIETDIVREINICISTSVGSPYKNKKEFIDAMNSKYEGLCRLNMKGSVSKDCNCVIWSKEGNKTGKVKDAEKKGIEVYTGEEFDKLLEELLKS